MDGRLSEYGPSPSGTVRPFVPATAAPSPLLVCYSHLRWDFVWQRPQHLLGRAAGTPDVVFVEEPVWEDEIAPRLDASERPGGIELVVPVMRHGMEWHEVLEAERALLDAHLAARLTGRNASRPVVRWYYTPMALAFSTPDPADVVVYDNMDELSAFRGASPEMVDFEAELLARADLVFTGGMSLYEAKRDRHPAVHAFPSSIDFAHFATARTGLAEPDDQAGRDDIRIGFFGVIDERMDIDLVGALADLRPDWTLVMIGPVVKIDPETLPRRPNIRWLGPKGYGELPAYLAGWTAGFMPFALNEATRFISPTKTPEFLAAGLPLASTPIRDVVRPYGEDGLVAIAADAGTMAVVLEAALAAPRAEWLARVDRHLAGTSWDRTWGAMLALIVQAQVRRTHDSRDVADPPILLPLAS